MLMSSHQRDYRKKKVEIMEHCSSPQQTDNRSQISSLCVFCGSGEGADPAFKKTATQLGHLAAALKIHLIYGGGDMGLMGALAQGALDEGGKVTGIIPEFLLPYQQGKNKGAEQIITRSMHERKARMYDMAGAFIALPGGIGTLEELVETMTWEQLGQHKKPIILLDINGFWQPFISLLAHMKTHHFIRSGLEVNFHIIEDLSDLPVILGHSDIKTTLTETS